MRLAPAASSAREPTLRAEYQVGCVRGGTGTAIRVVVGEGPPTFARSRPCPSRGGSSVVPAVTPRDVVRRPRPPSRRRVVDIRMPAGPPDDGLRGRSRSTPATQRGVLVLSESRDRYALDLWRPARASATCSRQGGRRSGAPMLSVAWPQGSASISDGSPASRRQRATAVDR